MHQTHHVTLWSECELEGPGLGTNWLQGSFLSRYCFCCDVMGVWSIQPSIAVVDGVPKEISRRYLAEAVYLFILFPLPSTGYYKPGCWRSDDYKRENYHRLCEPASP